MKLFVKSILFAGAFGGALFLLMNQGEDHGELHFWELNPADIASVRVVTADQDYHLSPEESRMQSILHLHARSILGGKNDAIVDYKLYGLAEPLSRIVINLNSGQKKELLIGHRSPLGDTYYVKLSSAPSVYLVSVYLLREVLKGASNPH